MNTFTVKKMYWMELHVVVFILVLSLSASKFYWTVSNKPVMYGDNIILTCKIGHVLTDRDECPVRQWYGGHKDKLLLYNQVSWNATKYEDRTNLSSTEFSLVIKNYTESDLNIKYTCSCGFKSYTKHLGLNDEDFIVPPLRVDTYIQQCNETLSIYLHVERVYPRPVCFIAIGERTIFNNLSLTSVKCDVFCNATFEASINIVADDCGKKPTLLCYIGNEHSIVNTSGEPIRNCTAGVSNGSSDDSGYLVPLLLLIITFVFCDCPVLSSLYRNRAKIRNHLHSDDLLSRKCWDWRRSVLAIALTVIVISIDICTKTYSTKYLVNEANGDDIATPVGLCVSSLLLTPVLLCLISTPDIVSIREGFRVAVSRFDIKKMIAIPCKEYREVPLEENNVNSSSGDGSDDIATTVGFCVSYLLYTPLILCLISTPDISIIDGFRVAVSRFDIKKMIAIRRKEYREVPLEENNVNSSSDLQREHEDQSLR